MSQQYIRVYKPFDVKMIKPNILIYGDISGTCGNCQRIDLKLELTHCPECKNEFKYIAFRNIRSHWPKVHKLVAERPNLIIMDYEDYSSNLGANKAREFLK